MTGNRISDMPTLGALPASGAIVPVVKSDEDKNYSFDLAAMKAALDAADAARPTSATLAAVGGAAGIGSAGPSNVQADINALKAVDTALAGTTGASLVGYLSSFTGAVARTVGDWLDDRLSVMDFISFSERVKIRLRTSTADHAAAIGNAVAAAISSGRDLYLPAGDYNVSTLPITLTSTPPLGGLTMRGAGSSRTRLKKFGSSSSPIIDLSHTTVPQTANVMLSDFGVYGSAKICDGIRNTAAASVHLDGLWIENCAVGVSWVGAIANTLSRTYIENCTIGVRLRKSGTAYANANTLTAVRISNCPTFAIDIGEASLTSIAYCDIEDNGTAGNTATGAVIVRSSADDEIGFAKLLIHGTWFERNRGRTIQTEAFGANNFYCSITSTNILTSESGRAIYAAGGGVYYLQDVSAPSPGDTFDITASRLAMAGSRLHTLSGTRTEPDLISTTEIGGAPVEGTHQRGIHIGGGYKLTLSWGNGTGAYSINGNSGTGDLDFLAATGGSGVANFGLHVNLASGKEVRINGQRVLTSRQAAIPDTSGAALATLETEVNKLKAMARAHGLIA